MHYKYAIDTKVRNAEAYRYSVTRYGLWFVIIINIGGEFCVKEKELSVWSLDGSCEKSLPFFGVTLGTLQTAYSVVGLVCKT